jgi:hypothetical protein
MDFLITYQTATPANSAANGRSYRPNVNKSIKGAENVVR